MHSGTHFNKRESSRCPCPPTPPTSIHHPGFCSNHRYYRVLYDICTKQSWVCVCWGVQTQEQQDGVSGQNAEIVMRVEGHVLLLPPLMIPSDSTLVSFVVPKPLKKTAPNSKLLESKKHHISVPGEMNLWCGTFSTRWDGASV